MLNLHGTVHGGSAYVVQRCSPPFCRICARMCHSCGESSCRIWDTERFELLPGSLQVVIDDDLVVHAGCLGVLDLICRLGQPLFDRLLLVSPSTTQPLLEDLDGWRLEEEEARFQVGLLDLLDALRCARVSTSRKTATTEG